MFKPSKYQQALFDEINEPTTQHVVVEAYAGSGKTTTILEALKLLPANKQIGFVAFNKHIADELATKAPEYIQVSTLHSLGLASIRAEFGKFKVDASKSYKILKPMANKFPDDQRSKFISAGIKVLGLLKSNLQEPDQETIEEMAEYYSIYLPSEVTKFVRLIARAYEIGASQTDNIDFDDMIFLPDYYGLMPNQFDYLFVDEAQDLNQAQLSLIMKAVKPTGRLIAVGDRHQSIYGFRGADARSIPNIIDHFKAKVLPLSITYRCPTKIVELAQQFVPKLEASPDADSGAIRDVDYVDFYDLVTGGDLTLCRYNAPLIKPCFELIKQGRKATIRGSDIGKSLVTLIKSFNAKDTDGLRQSLEIWLGNEIQQAKKKGRNPQSVEDRVECIYALIDLSETTSVQVVIDNIKEIFSDHKSEIVLSSIHKSKGLEAESVFILEPQLMPCKHAEQPWEMVQEDNIYYVAITRTKQNLYYVR